MFFLNLQRIVPLPKRCWLLFLFPLLLIDIDAHSASADQVKKVIEKQVRQEEQMRKQFEQWESEKAVLLSEIRDLKIRSTWLDYQQIKYRNYLVKQQQVIEELKEKKISARRIRMELEPLLDQLIVKLEKEIKADLPFLQTERMERLEFLKSSLADYHIDLSEKLRRILEALRVEAEYGKTVEKTEAMLTLNEKPTKVMMIRIGRIALYYRTLEGKQIGFWNTETNAWEQLPSAYASDLAKAAEMASGKRAVELLRLPVGKPRRKEH